jgi:hypothetical protein
MHNEKKQWRARVLLTMRTTDDDGKILTITPGEYTLSESEGARYELARGLEKPVCLSFWFAELLLCAYMGQLEILGVWP